MKYIVVGTKRAPMFNVSLAQEFDDLDSCIDYIDKNYTQWIKEPVIYEINKKFTTRTRIDIVEE